MHMLRDHDLPEKRLLTSRTGLVLLGFLVIAGALLLTEHRAHVLGVLVWLLPFGCLLMHLFLHGGRGGHGNHRNERRPF
ncbi:DUF2933 domain-containing protein [Mesorhizobium sp. L-8-3]|uniref:DUF2933 domain-containing protein n=1 Tax=Mesorhizobium sp. L-8-3 TaxID=2744522 RepID=UPI0019276C25|nr:DUF2933 domain-containing protein [Mesorhizobium sp. L-8-3]